MFENEADFMHYMEQILINDEWTAEDKAYVLGALVMVDLYQEYPEWTDNARTEVKQHK